MITEFISVKTSDKHYLCDSAVYKRASKICLARFDSYPDTYHNSPWVDPVSLKPSLPATFKTAS